MQETTLIDPTDYAGRLPIKVEVTPRGVSIYADGHGDCGSAVGHGSPVFLELYQGRLRLLVWGDINQEDPTHVIDLSGAKENCRKPEGT